MNNTFGAGGRNRLATSVTLDALNVIVDGPNSFAYDADGALVQRVRIDPGTSTTSTDQYAYSWRDLTRQFVGSATGGAPGAPSNDWRYRYAPSAEREQKRMYTWRPLNDSIAHSRAWAYYALGLGKEQLAVYNGLEVYGTSPKPLCEEFQPDRVYFYPTEFNTYGLGLLGVTTRPDALSSAGVKEYLIADHLGTPRVSLTPIGTATVDHEPFGAVTGLSAPPSRQSYVAREVDIESGDGDFGFRHYDAASGRFPTVDPLWPLSPGVSPYVYCENDPINLSDPLGLSGSSPLDPEQKARPVRGPGHIGIELGIMLNQETDWAGATGGGGPAGLAVSQTAADDDIGGGPPPNPNVISRAIPIVSTVGNDLDSRGRRAFRPPETFRQRAARTVRNSLRNVRPSPPQAYLREQRMRAAQKRLQRNPREATERNSGAPASSFVKRRGQGPDWDWGPTKPPRNSPAVIAKRYYTGHALDRMQERGFTPSVVETAIRHGIKTKVASEVAGTYRYTHVGNNVTVIVVGGRVVTVY